MRYFALLRKEPDSDFSVDFPDFPGCVTAGETLEEARKLAAEVLEFHIDGMLEDRLPIPPPAGLESIMADPDNAEALPFIVEVPDHRSRAVRVNLTMSETDLEALDALAKKQGKSRSALLAEAARRMIAAETDHAA
ncbi:MAG: type II toxin-antitoxin system HicB family antitoxin [Geminicoccaceae bacterium]